MNFLESHRTFLESCMFGGGEEGCKTRIRLRTMLRGALIVTCLLVVVLCDNRLNPCRGSYHKTSHGWVEQTPVHLLTESGAVQNFAGCHETLPRQCYLGDCIDTGCWLALPRTQGEEETAYYVQAPYMTPCLYGFGRCVRGTCVAKEDAKRYRESELYIKYFTIPNIAQFSSSFEVCSQHPDCLELWNDNCSLMENKPTHLGEEISSWECAPMRFFNWPEPTAVGIEYFAEDGMLCEEEGECYGGRCFASDFPPYCPPDHINVNCDGWYSCKEETGETGEDQLPGCSGRPPAAARAFV